MKKGLLVLLLLFALMVALVAIWLVPWWLRLMLLTIIILAPLLLLNKIIRLACEALVEIPTANYGIVLRKGKPIGPEYSGLMLKIQESLDFTRWFGKRKGGVLYNGLHLKWWFEKVEVVSLKLGTTPPIKVKFNTKDRPQLTCTFSVQYRPDPTLNDKDGNHAFFFIDEEKLPQEIEESLQSKVGGIGTKYDSSEFIKNRQAVTDIINFFLRTSVPPHIKHVHISEDLAADHKMSAETCGLENKCKHKGRVNATQLIKWYNDHWPLARRLLQNEAKNTADRSPFEERYGIDIVEVPLADVKFPDDIEKAFAQKRQLEENRKSFEVVLGMDDELEKRGYTPQLRANMIQTHTGQAAPRQVISVEGNGQAVVVTGGLPNLFGGRREKQDNPDKPNPDKGGKKGGR